MTKTAFVTGCTRGIGKAIALGFLRDSWNVAACGRNLEMLQNLASDNDKIRLLPLVFDVKNEKSIKDAIDKCLKQFHSIDVLVNNAGIYKPGTLEISSENLDEIYEVNVKAPWEIMNAVVPHMKQHKSGYIINIASVAGLKGYAGVGAYCTSKFALRGMTESVFRELNAIGIKVTTINPSWVSTDMSEHAPISKEQMIQPNDIYRTIKFLTTLEPTACISEITIQCTSDIL